MVLLLKPEKHTVAERKLRLFAGYQFKSTFFSRSELEAAILRAIRLANDEGKSLGFSLQFAPPDLDPGDFIFSQLQQRIAEADISLFDISDGNGNVYFEVGVATGLQHPTILMKHVSSPVPIPTDLSGIMYVRYENVTELAVLLSVSLIQIAKTILSKTPESIEAIAKSVWVNGRTREPVTVICGEVGSAFSPSDVEGVHYVQSPDVQALVEVGGNLLALRPDRPVKVASCSAISGTDMEEHLVCVGGPRSNSVTREVLSRLALPWRYELGDPNLSSVARMKVKALVNGSNNIRPDFDGNSIRRDVCMLAFGPNPFNTSRRFLIFTGAFTYGVLGAARAVSAVRQTEGNRSSLLEVLNRTSSTSVVQIVCFADVIKNQVVTPDLSKAFFELQV
jgi:hypothetical protein